MHAILFFDDEVFRTMPVDGPQPQILIPLQETFRIVRKDQKGILLIFRLADHGEKFAIYLYDGWKYADTKEAGV